MTEITDSEKKSAKSAKADQPSKKAKSKAKGARTKENDSLVSLAAEETKAKRGRRKTIKNDELLEQLQKQLTENQVDLIQIIKDETRNALSVELRRADRRRRWNNFWRDIIIIILAVGCGYLGYLTYDLSNLNDDAQDNSKVAETTTTAGPIKDDAWYLANYSYLYERTRANLNADNVSAYYLYNGDLAVNNIRPEYLLNIAYQNFVTTSPVQVDEPSDEEKSGDTKNIITVSASDLQSKFTDLFSDDAKFRASDFVSGCLDFVYQKSSDSFEAEDLKCQLNQHREIVEKIEKIYEEGEVIYITTNAGVYDKDEKSFYNFDDLFKPVAEGASKQEFEGYAKDLNRYQYQFKKSGEDYKFSKIVKLR